MSVYNPKDYRPPAWECRAAKASRLYKEIKQGKKVSRWEVYPLRHRLLKLAEKDPDQLEKLELLINEAKASQ